MPVQMAYTNLFIDGAQTAKYAKFRPTYPAELFDAIFQYTGQPKPLKVAADVATGSGQVIKGLVGHCEKIVGVDASEQQISNAPQLQGVEYRQGDAHSLPIDSASVDLVTVGQALHWFDRPKFYAEAVRVLRPTTGVLAAWSYSGGVIHPAGGGADREYKYMLNDLLGPWWASPRMLVEDRYTSIEPMEPFFEHTQRQDLSLDFNTSVDGLVGYVASWSAYIAYCQAGNPDPLPQFAERLRNSVAQDGSDPSNLLMSLPLVLLMAKGPKQQH